MSPDRNPEPTRPWTPNTDVFINRNGDCIIKVEIAGMRKENVELTVDKRRLTITGSRSDPETDQAQFLVRELGNSFQSVIEIPEQYDLKLAKAAYQNGILRIIIPLQKING